MDDSSWASSDGRAGAPLPGKRTLTESMYAVQADGEIRRDPHDVHAAAAAGVEGASSTLPHLETIQRAFGRHDVRNVRAQIGGRAASATAAMGAKAFARGETVAFATTPDLRQAAHEAAHVIQQRAGVSLAGGVGRAGDRYEQHADAVAERVVRGLSAEALLDTIAGSSGGGSRAAVQRDGGEDDERVATDADRERMLRRAAARRRARRAEATERVEEPGDRAALDREMSARRRADEDEAHERVAEPGDAEALLERVRASREEAPLEEPDERMERVVRDGDAEALLERARGRRDEPMSTPDPEISDLERDYREDRADPSPEGRAARRERRRPESMEREARPGDREALESEIADRRRGRPLTEEERLERDFRRREVTDARHDAAIAGMRRITTDDPTSASISAGGGDVSTTGVAGHVRVSDRGGGGGVTVGPRDGRRARVMARGETTEDGGTRAGVDVRGSGRIGEHGAHVEGGASVERGRDGEMRGATGRLGGGYRGVSATASAGYRCFAERPVQDPADRTRFTVAWTVSISRELGLEFHIGATGSDELERTGTRVFRAANNTEAEIVAAQQRAQTWRDQFQHQSQDEVIAMFTSTSTGHDTDLEFWRIAEVGTRVSVRVRRQISASLALPILGLFEVGASYEGRWQDTALIAKVDATHVDVTQTAEVRDGGSLTAGTFGTDVTGGGRIIGSARVVTRVELAAGGDALSRMLADGADLEEQPPAVVVRERTRTEGRTSTSSSGFGTLGVDEDETTSHETGMRIDEATGLPVPVDVYHAEDVETTTGGFLFDTTGTFQVDAPAAGNDSFVIRHAITGRDARAVRRELADALGTPDSSERGHSSHDGTWNIVEEFTQDEIARFCTGYVAHFEELDTSLHDPEHLEHVGEPVSLFGLEVFGGSAYNLLYHRLRDLRDASGAAAQRIRAQAIAAFLCSTNEEGVRVIRAGAGASGAITLTRSDSRGAADTNFMSVTERRALETQITDWTALADSGETAGIDAAVADIDRQLVAMRERRDHVDDQEGYAALPLAARHDLVAGYALYISQLEALVTRLRRGQDESIASGYGTETQEEYRAMEAERIRTGSLRDEIVEMRGFTIDHRRYFGQERSEEWRARLGASATTRTNRLFRQAEANRIAAEEDVTGAEHVLADSRLSPTTGDRRFEETMSTLYHRARDRFTEAAENYEQCRDQLRELNVLYTELAAAAHTDEEPAAEPDPDATSAATEATSDTERAPRRARRDATGGAAPTTEAMRAVVDQAPLRALVAVNGIAVTVRHAEVTMNAGLRVRVVRHQVPATTEAGIAANGGIPVIFGLEIAHAASGFDSFLAPMFATVTDGETGMVRQIHSWDRVTNQVGVAFQVLTFVAV